MMLYKVFFSLCLVITTQGSVTKRQASPCPDECKNLPLDIAFVIDASSSIWPQNFTLGLWFVENFVDKFNIAPDQVRVSAVTFGDRVYTEDAFGFAAYTNKEDLKNAIESLPYHAGQSTETGAAISYMLDNQIPNARPEARKVAIVLTDGNSQKTAVTKAEAERALSTGLEVFAIGVGHDVTEQELHNIASDNKHVFIVGTYHMLDTILERLAFETCGVQPHPVCQFDPVDIAFVIDSSSSIGEGNFTIGLEFIREFLEVFEINPSAVRVAAIMFGDRVYSESAIPFDAYSNKKDTLDAIMDLDWMHGSSTETAQGIDYMIENFLPNTRPYAAHIGIVITDGMSQLWKKTEESAQAARDAGLIMTAVGVGKVGETIDMKELTAIAGDPSRVLIAVDYGRLNLIREDLTHLTCSGISDSLTEKQQGFYETRQIITWKDWD